MMAACKIVVCGTLIARLTWYRLVDLISARRQRRRNRLSYRNQFGSNRTRPLRERPQMAAEILALRRMAGWNRQKVSFGMRIIVNTLGPEQNAVNVLQTILEMHFLEWEMLCLPLNFTEVYSKGPLDNMSVLIQVMGWHETGDKSLPEPGLDQWYKQCCGT